MTDHRPFLSVIVPTFNEELHITAFLESVMKAIVRLAAELDYGKHSVEVVVVDGGSRDSTLERVKNFPVKICRSARSGRGLQMREGVQASSGEYVLMLHADSTIDEEGLLKLWKLLRQNPQANWGIVGHSYSSDAKRFKWVQVSNFLRFTLLGIAFGDQGIFVRRSVLESVGGIPDFRLMEDVELSLRLRGAGPRVRLGGGLCVSARRWERKGSLRYTVQVLSLVSRYFFLRLVGSDMLKVTDRMYAEYYSS